MKNIVLLTSICSLIFLTSCEPTRVYTTGSYASLKSYTEKLEYRDQKATATYISGDVSFGRHPQDGRRFNDKKTIVSLNVHRSTSGRFYNFYYGLGGSYGTYKFKEGYFDFVRNGEKKNFFNINFKAGANYAYTRPKIDYRFIGIEFAYLNEFGPYQDKLSELSGCCGNNLIIANQSSMFTYNIYSEYVFKLSHESALTMGFYFGDLLNYKNTESYSGTIGFGGFVFGLKIKEYTISAVFESGEGDISSTKIGLTYQIF